MPDKLSRREFLQESAAGAAGLAAAAELAAAAPEAEARTDFTSQWQKANDRVWLGAEYWANPLQDWRIANGRVECVKAAPNRNVHLLTRRLGQQPGGLQMSVRLGRVGGPLRGTNSGAGKGSAGFRIGIRGPLADYRNSLIYGQGLDAGITADGRLFMGKPDAGVPIELSAESVELRLTVDAGGERSKLALSAHAADGNELARTTRESVASESLSGNLALVANFAYGNPNAAKRNAPKNNGANPKPADNLGAGEFWFSDWTVGGDRAESHDADTFGPILFSQYSLSRGVLKLSAQMPPLGANDEQTVRLEVERDGKWVELAHETIHPEARTAAFRIEPWDAARDVRYRVAYSLSSNDGRREEHYWPGVIRRDPVDRDVLTVGDVSCNIHEAFPNAAYTANMAKLNPDLIAFVGDQFYESSGGYGVERAPLAPAVLDYLRKWHLHGWTWRELMRDRPTISIPDDHDVYQGNIWGEGGAPQTTTQEAGGYNMPAPWVNVVQRTQTSHLPDPWDATPCKQGIRVYSCSLVYGRVSFAVLADRQFKSGPEGKTPPTGGRGDHVTDPNFDPASADLPGLQLLGPGQLEHLRAWATDWRGAEMKAVVSQTIFTAMATTHGEPNGRLVADYDTNGWPQSERNAALREIRKAFAFHVAGDQHLPAIVHYGIDEHGDAGLAFAGPAVNTGYPRWFEPLSPGENRAPGAPENTGEFRDSFGHPLSVLAVADGKKQPRAGLLEKLHDKVSGLGLVRFDKRNRKITVECWPFLADPTQPGTQFAGWPRTFDVLANYGRKAAAHLPRLDVRGVKDAVAEVIDEASGELVYSLRIGGPSWQPHVFAPGRYTVRISDPDAGRSKELTGLTATPENRTSLEVS
ncbi:MAG TPA: alkaline phosphatase D family protein, partial [Pirellulales bacterium]|nr:alkaline phosphatase D family protein [Pirellulales bacterium]